MSWSVPDRLQLVSLQYFSQRAVNPGNNVKSPVTGFIRLDVIHHFSLSLTGDVCEQHNAIGVNGLRKWRIVRAVDDQVGNVSH